ncbi:E3 ubiquitin/ISG15 ligase TRIM25 [Brienomyrus brachyistius]|uniref:E3 ubiquitin/ISG15 ligase TRIM25 n=1 Tax=Brienomyrus brachyistius TaxID=42636 RepID=UPI0020B26343|nr:E3 ubiquitin/ISG15 ligase TRIM25 [Brienomyrus brachyistius]
MAGMGAAMETAADVRPPTCPVCGHSCSEPSTLRCGHCFCTNCIQELWSGSPTGPYYCPECRDEYRKLPAFAREDVDPPQQRNVAEQGYEFSASPASSPTAGGPAVTCHYCPATAMGRPAAMTCLVCGASMCVEHLQPHLESPVFQNHPLVEPLADISQWRCQEHQEMNKIFCRDCGTCVCTVCTVIGVHRGHACISVSEAEKELREKLKSQLKTAQKQERVVRNRVDLLTQKKEDVQLLLDSARSRVQEQYAAMREALELEELQAVQSLNREESWVMGCVGQKLSLQTDLLKDMQLAVSSLKKLMYDKERSRMQDQAFITEYNKITKSLSGIPEPAEDSEPDGVDKYRLQQLQAWAARRVGEVKLSMPSRDALRLLYGTVPSLNPDTAHPKLVLSEKNRKVTYSEDPQPYPELAARFSVFPQVLGSRCHEAGRVYWEVEVSSEGRWRVGVCEALIERKGGDNPSRLGYNRHSWCLFGERNKVEVLHDTVTTHLGDSSPQRVGVYLDLEVGSLSFYSVTEGGDLALLHSFQHTFTQPLYPALAVSKTQLTFCNLFQPTDDD